MDKAKHIFSDRTPIPEELPAIQQDEDFSVDDNSF